MTSEMARILANAVALQRGAMETMSLGRLGLTSQEEGRRAAETYVHETRIINRIVSEARDDEIPGAMSRSHASIRRRYNA